MAEVRMRLGVALVLLGMLLGAARAEGAARWELKPKVPGATPWARPLPLADGRLLVCAQSDEAQRCKVFDPALNEQQEVPVTGPSHRFWSALALDDGQLLLTREHALLDVFSGKKRPLPPTARPLAGGVTITGGRAAFVPECERVLFFMGVDVGFREVVAAPTGFCVDNVFDLGDGRVLIARVRAPSTSDDGYVDFVAFDLASSRFQRGPSLNHRHPQTAFVHGGEIIVLLHSGERRADGGAHSEALFIDRSMQKRKLVVFQQGGIGGQVARFDSAHWLLFDGNGSLLWDPTRGTLGRIPFPSGSASSFTILRRAGALYTLFYDSGAVRALAAGPELAPCAEVATYATSAIAEQRDGTEWKRVDELLNASAIDSCRRHVEQTRRFPESIQAPLEALLLRRQGIATREEQVAARIVCTVLPKDAVTLVPRINATRALDETSAKICQEANAVLPVLAEAGTPRLGRALVRHGLWKEAGRLSVRWEVQRLLERRNDLAQQAGPLLREARDAEGADTLRMALCTSRATSELARACTEMANREGISRPSAPNPERPRLARNLGIVTGVIGSLAGLAYLDRHGDGGRAIAIGSGIAGGATLGFLGTFAFAGPTSDLEGLGTLLLATALGVGGGIGGGALAAHTSRNPGDARFASAAVPLGGVWLTAVGFTIDDW